jgi:hypothetical protein
VTSLGGGDVTGGGDIGQGHGDSVLKKLSSTSFDPRAHDRWLRLNSNESKRSQQSYAIGNKTRARYWFLIKISSKICTMDYSVKTY